MPYLAQAAALNYDYYVRTEPVEVTCRAHARDAVRFFQDTGVSRSFFSSHAWDNATRKATEDHSIRCDVHLQPVDGESQEAQRRRLLNTEQQMKQEFMAEFINNMAARSTVVAKDSNVAPDSIDAIAKKGGARSVLCHRTFLSGGCQVVDIGLHYIRNLLASSSSQSTRRDDVFDGEFTRSYNEHAYTLAHGAAVISLTVPVQ